MRKFFVFVTLLINKFLVIVQIKLKNVLKTSGKKCTARHSTKNKKTRMIRSIKVKL